MRFVVWVLLITLLLPGCSFDREFAKYQIFVNEKVNELKESFTELTQIGGLEIEYAD